MSEVPESNEKKGELVMKLKKKLILELNKLLFNNTSDDKGGEEVRKLFRTFQDDVFKVSRRVASYSLAGKWVEIPQYSFSLYKSRTPNPE